MSKALATKNVVVALVAAALVVGFSLAYATTAKAQTVTTTSTASYTFTLNEKLGSKGAEVMQIQKFLNSNGFTVATTGAGSAGNETTTFGPATLKAVKAFQTAKGISPVSGYWGPLTRAAANAGGTTTTTGGGTTTTTTGPGLTVTAAAQPANSLAPQGTSRVPFTTFTLTNNTSAAVTVTGVTVQRAGLAQDGVFSGIVLVDQNGLQVGVSRTFNSNHQTTVGDTFTVPAGASVTYTVSGNMQSNLAAYAGQVVALTVVGVNTTVPVSGSLPITGAQQTINATLTAGSVTANISSFDPQAPTTKHIGDTAVRFSGVRFTAGSAEDVKMYSERFRLNGSVGPTDISNLVIVVNGTSYPTTWSADGRYVTAVFPGGLLIAKGNSVDTYLQGDITGSNAANRTVEFDIDRTSDVYFVGQTYGYGIQPAAGSNNVSNLANHNSQLTNSQPYFQGAIVTVSSGTATTIANSPSVAAANVAVNVPNQTLGGFDANFTGEPVTVQGMTFTVATTSNGTALDAVRSVSIVDSNGSVLAGPVDGTYSASTGVTTLTFSNSITFPTGLHTYSLKGTVPSDYANGASIQLTTNPTTWTGVQGQLTGNTITIGAGSFTMNTMTVRAATLAITASPSPAANTIVAGGQKIVFANIQLDASQSGEDVRIASFPVYLTLGGSASASSLSACQIWNGTTALNNNTTLNTLAAGQNTITLDNSLTVAKGTTLTLALTCNLSSSASANNTFQFGVNSSSFGSTGIGANSGNTVTPTVTTGNSGVQTVATAATLAVTVDSSSPSYASTAGGTTGVTVGVVKLRPTNEGVNLTKLGLVLTSGTASDLSQVYLYSGSTLIGTASFNGANTSATSTFTNALNLPVNTDTLITIKADLAQIGIGNSGVEGDLVKINPLNAEGTGASSGQPVRVGASTGVQGVRIFKTFPTIAKIAVPSTTLTVGQVDLYRFSVTANSTGNVGLYQFTANLATSTASISNGTTTVSNVKLYAYNDAGFNNPVSNGSFVNGLLSTVAAPVNGNNALNFGAALQVPAGTPIYFRLVGTVSQIAGSNGSSGSVSTYLVGDTSFTGMTNVAGVTASSTIWSPNATTTAVAADSDWTNGYLVAGIPTLGSDIVTLSK